MQREEVFTVRGDAELIVRAGHLFDSVRTEFVCAARDLRTWSQPQARAAVGRRAHGPGSSGVATRKLLSPVALADEEARTHLRRVRGLGAQVRISGSQLPHETILIDRRVMILAGQPSPPGQGTIGREYTVTTSPTLVEGVHSLFDAIWQGAADLEDYLRGNGPQLDEDGRTVLRALASGLTDAAAAKGLGLSLRTYRRRVAELMAELEADSRFQAGVRAGQLGLSR